MTFKAFQDTWNNKKLERVDNSNYAQCFDLAVAYCEDVLGLPRAIFAGLLNAYQIYDSPTPTTGSNFDFIKNTPWAVPKTGDIIVWGKTYGPSGHVAVVVKADVNNFTAFSQNDPVGSPCIMKNYGYTHVIGWLRKVTNSISSDEVTKLKEEFKITEKRLIDEKDQAVREGEQKLLTELAKAQTQCELKIISARKEVKEELKQKIMNFTSNL